MTQIEQTSPITGSRPSFTSRYPLIGAYYPELLVLLIAIFVRFWGLSYHSIWFDEAVSLRWAGSDPGFTWRKTFPLVEEKHPPVYYIGLHFWQKLLGVFGLGHNDAALRALGSILGVLTVLGMMLLARRAQRAPDGRATALLTGLLVALSPVLVWYSQELRMFEPAATCIVWASYCLLRAWQEERSLPRVGWWLGFIGVMEAALYSYLFSAFMLPAAGFTLLILLIKTRQHRSGHPHLLQRFGEGALVLSCTGLAYLPLAYNAFVVVHHEGTPGRAFAHVGQTLWRLLHIFTVWRVDWPTLLLNGVLAFFSLLLLLGLLLPVSFYRRKRKAPEATHLDRAWLVVWLGTPLLIGNVLLSFNSTVFAEDRYFLFIAPFALWAIARGVIVIGQQSRAVGWICSMAAVVLLGVALPRLWTPTMYRENWRAASRYLADYQHASPGLSAAVVTHVDYTHIALEWYLHQNVLADQWPVFFPYGGTLTPDQMKSVIAPPLKGIVKTGVATIWLTQSHLAGVDDQRLVEQWLNEHFPVITEQYPTGIKLSGYALQSRFTELPPLVPSAVKPMSTLAPGLTLAACELLTPQLAAHDEQMHPPSGWVHLRLWWQATGAIGDDYIATAQMVGPQGVWGDRLYRDHEALRRWPTHSWLKGEIVRDEVDINLNPVTPNGVYPIIIGVMNSKGEPVGGKVGCGNVKIIN